MSRKALALLVLLCPIAVACPIVLRLLSQRSSPQPLDGRLLLLLSTDPCDEPRKQIDDTPRSQMVFGLTVDGWQPGQPDARRCGRLGISDPQPQGRPAGRILRAGGAQPVRDLSSRRWQHREAAHGSGRRAAVEYLARQPVFEAAESHIDGRAASRLPFRSPRRFRPSPRRRTPNTSGTSASRAQLLTKILGPADVSGRQHPGARGL